MPQQALTTLVRRPRLDAQRNRERILEVAREVFAEHGPEATLDQIARSAEVGPGTLYRHFPTRDALIEAVFRSQVEKLTAAGERFAATLEPVDALRAWMFEFIEYVVGKVLIMPAMDTVAGGSTRMIEGTRGAIHGTFHRLVQRGRGQVGGLRAGNRSRGTCFFVALSGARFPTSPRCRAGSPSAPQESSAFLIEGCRTNPHAGCRHRVNARFTDGGAPGPPLKMYCFRPLWCLKS